MDFLLLLFLSVALSMDSLTISAIIGLTSKRFSGAQLFLPVMFGVSHLVMLLLGFFLSERFLVWIGSFDHWIAFFFLLFIGLKMILESKHPSKIIKKHGLADYLLLSLATSIDALALGITLTVLDVAVLQSGIFLGVVVAAFSYLGLFLGNRLSFLKPRYNYIFGGSVLILIGFKILLDHFF